MKTKVTLYKRAVIIHGTDDGVYMITMSAVLIDVLTFLSIHRSITTLLYRFRRKFCLFILGVVFYLGKPFYLLVRLLPWKYQPTFCPLVNQNSIKFLL